MSASSDEESSEMDNELDEWFANMLFPPRNAFATCFKLDALHGRLLEMQEGVELTPAVDGGITQPPLFHSPPSPSQRRHYLQ